METEGKERDNSKAYRGQLIIFKIRTQSETP